MKAPIFHQCKIISTDDPLMLGRVRGAVLSENYDDIIKSITNPVWNENIDPWTERDPFIFNPLLPYYIYQVPKVDELVQVIYSNNEHKFRNKFYIQNSFYSPTSSNFQYYEGGNKFTGTGQQIKNPKWLKNRDGSLINREIEGVFPSPEDNAILGRGSSDIIIKENDIILRSGKFKDLSLQPNVIPVGNPQRGFLQLSRFISQKVKLPDKTVFKVETPTILFKHLIEYVITNPENTQDMFSGTVYLYRLTPNSSVNSEFLSVDSPVPENLKTIIVSESFVKLNKIDVIIFINDFIKSCNDSNKTKQGNIVFNDNSDKFPIYYRPNSLTYNRMINGESGSAEEKYISEIFNNIKLNQTQKRGGFGGIYSKDITEKPANLKKEIVKESKYIPQIGTYAALGSDKVLLLSHKSTIPGKGKINFDGTLYGIDLNQFTDEILPKTSSMVRGEQLMELINLIVRFLVTHTHSYPGMPPVSITQDGTEVSQILSELQNAVNKILNENIRLN
jgi:hypothetical protein